MLFNFYAICQECGYHMDPIRVNVRAPILGGHQCPKCWCMLDPDPFKKWVDDRRQEMEEDGLRVSDR